MNEQVKLTVSDEVAIGIQGMNKWFGSFHVLRDIAVSYTHLTLPTSTTV